MFSICVGDFGEFDFWFATLFIKLRSKISVIQEIENLSTFAATLTYNMELGIHKVHGDLSPV